MAVETRRNWAPVGWRPPSDVKYDKRLNHFEK